jgi:hypothetical protein
MQKVLSSGANKNATVLQVTAKPETFRYFHCRQPLRYIISFARIFKLEHQHTKFPLREELIALAVNLQA